MREAELMLTAHDSTKLFVRSYSPIVNGSTDRTVVIVHGTSEHGGRYRHVARVMAEHGWQVLVPDLRGHGRSEGIPVHVDHYERYLLDLDTLWQYFELTPRRTAIMGHSFGGLVAVRFAQTRPHRLGALVLMSPLLGLKVEVGRFTLALGRLMSFVIPTTRFASKIPPAATTHDLAVLQRREVDPLNHRSVTAGWFFQMQAAIADAWRESAALQVPVRAMQAGDDSIVDPLVVEPWLKTVSSPDRSFQMLEGRYHELLNEPDWPTTLGMVCEWLEGRIPAVTAAVE